MQALDPPTFPAWENLHAVALVELTPVQDPGHHSAGANLGEAAVDQQPRATTVGRILDLIELRIDGGRQLGQAHSLDRTHADPALDGDA